MLNFRYHALSLVAVFLALAIGVVLGVAIGDKGVVSGVGRDLEKSLRGDLGRARERNADLNSQQGVRDAYESDVYPSLVRGMLRGDRVGIVAMGKLPKDVVDDVNAAIEPAGAKLRSVNVIAAPLPIKEISSDLGSSRLARRLRSKRQMTRLGRQVGRAMATGAPLPERLRHSLFSSSRGSFGRLDEIVFVRDRDGLEGADKRTQDTFESAFLKGLRSSKAIVAGVERQGTDPSQIGFMKDNDISSVDDTNLIAGQTALVYILAGREGHFGTDEDNLVPPPPKRY